MPPQKNPIFLHSVHHFTSIYFLPQAYYPVSNPIPALCFAAPTLNEFAQPVPFIFPVPSLLTTLIFVASVCSSLPFRVFESCPSSVPSPTDSLAVLAFCSISASSVYWFQLSLLPPGDRLLLSHCLNMFASSLPDPRLHPQKTWSGQHCVEIALLLAACHLLCYLLSLLIQHIGKSST